jgi:hypothetical protein
VTWIFFSVCYSIAGGNYSLGQHLGGKKEMVRVRCYDHALWVVYKQLEENKDREITVINE